VACRGCELNATPDLPAWERLYMDRFWRIAHAQSSLPGWLIVTSQQHRRHLGELEAAEAVSLGPLLSACSRALCSVIGATNVYVMLFAEAEGFQHVHLHVVPRMEWFTESDLGPGSFHFLREGDRVPDAEKDRLARDLGGAIRGYLAT
jgi:diadenosine tetraphosphate (Ap4A) HIT family hydrolase